MDDSILSTPNLQVQYVPPSRKHSSTTAELLEAVLRSKDWKGTLDWQTNEKCCPNDNKPISDVTSKSSKGKKKLWFLPGRTSYSHTTRETFWTRALPYTMWYTRWRVKNKLCRISNVLQYVFLSRRVNPTWLNHYSSEETLQQKPSALAHRSQQRLHYYITKISLYWVETQSNSWGRGAHI